MQSRSLTPASCFISVYRSYRLCHSSASQLSSVPYISAYRYQDRLAVSDQYGRHTYKSLLRQSHEMAQAIRGQAGDIAGERIVYLTPNNATNVVAQWAIWMCKAIAVPLCSTHPTSEKQYFVDDTQAKLVIGTEGYADEVISMSRQANTSHLIIRETTPPQISDDTEVVLTDEYLEQVENGGVESDLRSLIIYTSGTTGRPKGVVHTHGSLSATTQDMVESWRWTEDDRMLHVLPLHHIHGLINSLYVPLSVGASSVMLPKFSPEQVWEKLMDSETGINIFTAVPTIYAKLLEYYNAGKNPNLKADDIKEACGKIRLMVSGSSSLPIPVRDSWYSLTNHTLLERYGMSEILMALTHPYASRTTGTVGLPFKSVKAIIAKEDQSAPHGYIDVTERKSENNPDQSEEGELYIRGPTLFTEYWNKPEATLETFTEDGWFKTGDTVCRDSEGFYKILGRTSVDIIKCGGYKISALDIESKILLHPDISECSVVGVPSTVYGQDIAALIVLSPGSQLTEEELLTWCSDRIAKYSLPRTIIILPDSIPKNAMGKVNKKQLLQTYFPDS